MARPPVTSIPVAVLQDAVGQQVTVATVDGAEYRGTLDSVQPRGLSVTLSVVLFRRPDGMVEALPSVLVPGAQVKYIGLPEYMKRAPFFAAIRANGGAGGGGLLDALTKTKRGGRGGGAGKKKKKKKPE